MAAVVRVKYAYWVGGKWRWIPSRKMRKRGATAETLGKTLTAKAAARAEELTNQWGADEATTVSQSGTMAWLIKEYERSSWYAGLGRRTKENVDLALRDINDALGGFPVAKVGRQACRVCYEGVLAKRGPNAAKATHTYLRRLFSWAREIELRTDNPAEGMQIESPKPRRQKWTRAQVRAVIEKATEMDMPQIALLVQLGYDTGQRLTDLLTVTWNDYDGEGLSFIQHKTEHEVWVPLEAGTRSMLAETPRTAVQIITSGGKPYTNRAIVNRHFRAAARAAGVPDKIQFRDLRRTVASEISGGGGKIHSITGHTPGSSMERVYVVPDRDAARAAKLARKGNKT